MKFIFFTCFFMYGAAGSSQVSFNRLPNQPPPNIYSVVADPANGDIYACTTTTVLKSSDQGITWSQTGNTGMNFINVLYFSAAGQLYAGATYTVSTSLNGVTKYNKTTNTWSSMAGSPINVTAILDDGSGNVYAGTGTTSNTQPNPINYGTGIYLYNGSSWAAINTGMPNLSGYTVLPFIKDMKFLSNGNIIAATYGNGILKYNAGSWNSYGSGISNNYINCLYLNASGTLYAGTDANVSMLTGTTWSTATTGITPGKPVRVLTADVSGTMYAGLSFYVYQKGSISGEIFYSSNAGGLWQNAGAGFNSTGVVSMAVSSAGNIFAAANGIWKAASPNNWVYATGNLSFANNTEQMVKNQQGYWFVICRNPTSATPGCAGVFRSPDKGITWTSVNNGINCQKTDVIFCDSRDRLWLGTKEFIGASLNPAYGNPELYYSDDNGNTWTKENTIVTPSDGYSQIAEDFQGRVFITNSFGGIQSNISSSLNHGAFLNNLFPPPNNGGKSYGLAIDTFGHILFGTETIGGIVRSVNNGAPGSFVSLAPTGTGYGPNGNVSVFNDPNTNTSFCNGTHGVYNGSIIPPTVFGSAPVDDGANLFLFNNLPDYCSLPEMAFDNRGNAYLAIKTSFPATLGLYFASPPWNSNTVFTRVISSGTISYYFDSFMTDECGYLYGAGLSGGGIYKSSTPVNTPFQSTLVSPANNAVGVPLTPVLGWIAGCMPDSFRLQIATDNLFTTIVKDRAQIAGTSYAVTGGLAANTKYYWRVYGVNAAGAGKWSSVNNFTTLGVVPLTLINFKAIFDHTGHSVNLGWTAVNEINTDHYIVERSTDGNLFTPAGSAAALPQPAILNNYSFRDDHFLKGKNFYRLKQWGTDGKFLFSNIIYVNTSETIWSVFPNPVKNTCRIQLPDRGRYKITIINTQGKEMESINNPAGIQYVDPDFKDFAPGVYDIRITDLQTGFKAGKKIFKN